MSDPFPMTVRVYAGDHHGGTKSYYIYAFESNNNKYLSAFRFGKTGSLGQIQVVEEADRNFHMLDKKIRDKSSGGYDFGTGATGAKITSLDELEKFLSHHKNSGVRKEHAYRPDLFGALGKYASFNNFIGNQPILAIDQDKFKKSGHFIEAKRKEAEREQWLAEERERLFKQQVAEKILEDKRLEDEAMRQNPLWGRF